MSRTGVVLLNQLATERSTRLWELKSQIYVRKRTRLFSIWQLWIVQWTYYNVVYTNNHRIEA